MEAHQRKVCDRYGATFTPPIDHDKVGISDTALAGGMPLHGLRYEPDVGTTGWYIWAGEWSNAENFFKPLHVHHLVRDRPDVLAYLALPPGWRFLIAPGHEDVWPDRTLLVTTG